MDQLKRMAVFAEVVAAGSLTAAARQLGMTPSAVSQHLRQLELSLGLALLHRSTRRLTLTEAGERAVGSQRLLHRLHAEWETPPTKPRSRSNQALPWTLLARRPHAARAGSTVVRYPLRRCREGR